MSKLQATYLKGDELLSSHDFSSLFLNSGSDSVSEMQNYTSTLTFIMVGLYIFVRWIDWFYHRDKTRVLQALRLVQNNGSRVSYFRRWDTLFAMTPFVWMWLEIIAVLWLSSYFDKFLIYLLAAIFVGSRFRALQEASHIAVHGGLCRSKRWQEVLSNLLAHYPLLKPDLHFRHIAHVTQHHWYANDPEKDPNVDRFVRNGVRPGLSSGQFYWYLLFPLSPNGMLETVVGVFRGVVSNSSIVGAALRAGTMISLFFLLISLFGIKTFLIAYCLPLLTIYPLFSWWSVLAEHRWFAEAKESDRFIRECTNGRPTRYSGLSGWFVKTLVCPLTDHYHLAHSLYPHVRWNYMQSIDEALRRRRPEYSRFESHGFLFRRGNLPSALSELRNRLSMEETDDLADWAIDLSEKSRAT